MVDTDVAAQSVIDAVRDGAGNLLEDVSLFDVYTGPQVGGGAQVADPGAAIPGGDRTLPRTRPAPPATRPWRWPPNARRTTTGIATLVVARPQDLSGWW